MNFHLPYLLLYVSAAASVLLGFLALRFELPELSSILLGLAIILTSIVIGFWSRSTLTKRKTAVSPDGEPSALVAEGPFARSRNPMYVSYVLAALGVAAAFASFLAFLPTCFYFIYLDTVIVPREELKLALHFPKEFRAYTAHVPRWI